MTTDDERREVAARLRHSWANVPDKNPVRHQLRVLFEIYSAVGLADDDDADAIDLFDRLADLIEPEHVGDSNKMVDRDALLALADEILENADLSRELHDEMLNEKRLDMALTFHEYACELREYAGRIREALGVES